MPQQPAAAALHRDLERLVELADAEGWSIDRVEIEEALPPALESTCRTTLATRQQLQAWLDARIATKGGDVERVYKERGDDLSEVSELLMLTRVQMLFERSNAVANSDCPFWLRETPNFRGRQILDDRWFVSLGGGGTANLVRQNGESDLNFGGGGRLLLGRGFGPHATILSGVEVAGSAAFPRDLDGERGDLTVSLDLGIPLVYRHRRVNSYWEVEAGYVAHTPEKEFDPAHGFQVGFSVGGSASRRRWLFPGAAFGIHYERVQDATVLHTIKLGFRAAIDISP